MYIETVAKKGYPPNILLRESYRKDGRVCKRTITNLTKWPPHVRQALEDSLKGKALNTNLSEGFEITRSLPHGHVAAVLGTLYRTELHTIISSKASKQRDLAIGMIVERVLNPCSKSASSRHFRVETLNSSLAGILGLEESQPDEFYEGMDWLLARQQSIEKKLAKKHLAEGNVVLYDVTSSYYEGRTCVLARYGHSRDKKKDKKQIVIGLICTGEGCPIAVEVFEGNTADPKTLRVQVEKLRTE